MAVPDLNVAGLKSIGLPPPPDNPDRKKKQLHFVHTKIINPFYEAGAPSIQKDPRGTKTPVPEREKFGFLSSSVRFAGRTKKKTKDPVEPTDRQGHGDRCLASTRRCPNGRGSMSSLTERFQDPCKVELSPGPTDYTIHPNAFKKSLSFNRISSTAYPILYGSESCDSSSSPGPNHYNVAHHPVTHCCNWRTYRSAFAGPKFQKPACQPSGAGPADYNVSESLTKPSVRLPVLACFQSRVPTLYSFIKQTSSADHPGPGWYDVKRVDCSKASFKRPVNTLLKYTAEPVRLIESFPGPWTYDIARHPRPAGPGTSAAFAPNYKGSRKGPESSPGPADYFPKVERRCRYRHNKMRRRMQGLD